MKNSEAARLLCDRIEELARVSDEEGRLTRTFLSPAMARANALVGGWMREAGLDVHEDTVGNLIGRARGTDPKAKTLLIGSHLDTVRNAGRFDGALGVLLPVVAMRTLRAHGVELPYTVEVLGFSEEEGVRFASGYLGSQAYCGKLGRSTLALRDAEGVSIREALEARNGGTFEAPPAAHRKRDLLGYVEVHIEQGPVLEAANLAVGVVSAIFGQSRFKIAWKGKAGHAGTTPMKLRRDALAGAAEFAVALEKLARRTPGLVATIGTIEVPGGASNVIPGEVRHTLDIRHAEDRVRKEVIQKLRMLGGVISGKRSLGCDWTQTQDDAAIACSPGLTDLLAGSVRRIQKRVLSVPSGAGHDSVVMASLAPVAMLFVRGRDGLSHHPDEFTKPADLGVALRVMIDFLLSLADREP